MLLLSPEEWNNGWRRRTAFRVAVKLLAIEEGGQEAGTGAFKSRFNFKFHLFYILAPPQLISYFKVLKMPLNTPELIKRC